jgi:hypothetical protein
LKNKALFMNNPAFRIWLEGQVVYATLHGIAILISIPASLWGGSDMVSGVAAISVLSILFEFFFALPAMPVFALWVKFLQLLKAGRYTGIALSLVAYISSMYFCARFLWFWLDGSWELRGGDTGFFYAFTAAALASAVVALVMNQRRLRDYICLNEAETLEEQDSTTITPQTDNYEG